MVGTPGSESKAEIEGTLAMTQLGLARLGWSDQRTKHEAEEYARRERLLLAYVPLSFDVALSLTRNRRLARELAREVLLWAWNADESVLFAPRFKSELLMQLRKRSACIGNA